MMKLQDYFHHYEQAHRHPANRLCHKFGIPLIVLSLILLVFSPWKSTGWILFGVGWVFQFVGHAIERSWPEFFQNPIYLLVGPLYFVSKLKRRFPR